MTVRLCVGERGCRSGTFQSRRVAQPEPISKCGSSPCTVRCSIHAKSVDWLGRSDWLLLTRSLQPWLVGPNTAVEQRQRYVTNNTPNSKNWEPTCDVFCIDDVFVWNSARYNWTTERKILLLRTPESTNFILLTQMNHSESPPPSPPEKVVWGFLCCCCFLNQKNLTTHDNEDMWWGYKQCQQG